MTSSWSGIDTWLPAPNAWHAVGCQRCGEEMRVPFAPSDGLCGRCRSRRRQGCEPLLEERLLAAGAPRKYAALTRAAWERKYGAWDGHPQYRHLVGWPQEHQADSWLLLIFSDGYGDRKTGLATAVLGEAIQHGLRGRWISQSDWLREIRSAWSGGPQVDPEPVVWRRAAGAPVLLFDDLGGVAGLQKSDKTWWRLQVTQLLHYRECRQRPTIVTANFSDWRQVGRIHQSLVSRMDVPLKILLPSERDHRAEDRKTVGGLTKAAVAQRSPETSESSEREGRTS